MISLTIITPWANDRRGITTRGVPARRSTMGRQDATNQGVLCNPLGDGLHSPTPRTLYPMRILPGFLGGFLCNHSIQLMPDSLLYKRPAHLLLLQPNPNVKAISIPLGSRGVLISCVSGKEFQAAREAISVFTEVCVCSFGDTGVQLPRTSCSERVHNAVCKLRRFPKAVAILACVLSRLPDNPCIRS